MSLRHDLLALTAEDLADISNRGTVKRATKELDRGKIDYELHDESGTLTVRWSDGPTCVLPAGQTVADADCDCPATGICRHLIRSVIAYQREREDEAPGPDEATEPWSPGDIGDETLGHLYSSQMLASLRRAYDDGLVVELVRTAKPFARFHKLGHTIRFLVPGDARYAQCDCTEKAPCRHAALAVWAFRLLPSDEEASIVMTGAAEDPASPELIGDTEEAVRHIIESGIANTPNTTMDRLAATGKVVRSEGLVWPAEILSDLRRQYEHYHAHDARFSPDNLADLVGELLIRFDALRAESIPVPQLFVRGHSSDGETKLGQSRLVGLGCGVRHRQRSVEIMALMQDDSSGSVVAVRRHFPDPTEDDREPETLSRLGAKLVVKGRDLATIGAGQLVIKTAKLYSDHRLSLGRSTASVYAQNYAYEELRAPVYAEGFGEVRARLAKLPPASLRPRRIGENFQVVQIASVEHARFSTREQAIRAVLTDASGETAELVPPYTTRNRHGTERLLNWLHRSAEDLVFVGGSFRLGASGLVVTPTAVIFDEKGDRTMIQPWVDDMDAHLETADVEMEPPADAGRPLDEMRRDLAALTGEAFLVGVEQTIAAGPTEWDRLESICDGLYMSSIARAIEKLRGAMANGDQPQTASSLFEIAVLQRLAQELG